MMGWTSPGRQVSNTLVYQSQESSRDTENSPRVGIIPTRAECGVAAVDNVCLSHAPCRWLMVQVHVATVHNNDAASDIV